jgi:hypothetical protein
VHTDLESLSTLRDLWHGPPMERAVRVGWWLEREEDIRDSHDERIPWLYDRWELMDRWIASNRAQGAGRP